jgi:hypothetical protein
MTVAVRNHFDGAWSDGFEIARSDHGHEPFQLRRRSDHSVLPADFSAEDVRPASERLQAPTGRYSSGGTRVSDG